jgi:hypothetical protein
MHLHKGYPPTIHSDGAASTGEARPAAVKIVTLSKYTFDDPIAVNAFERSELFEVDPVTIWE